MATANVNPFTFDRRTFGITRQVSRPRIQRQRSQQQLAATPPSYVNVGMPRTNSSPRPSPSARRDRERERERNERERARAAVGGSRDRPAATARDLVTLSIIAPSDAPPRYSQIGSVRESPSPVPPLPPVPQHRQRDHHAPTPARSISPAAPPAPAVAPPPPVSAVPVRGSRPKPSNSGPTARRSTEEVGGPSAGPSRNAETAQVRPPVQELAAVQLASAPATIAPPIVAAAPSASRSLLSRPVRTIVTDARFDHWRDGDICLRSKDGTLVPCHGANLSSASPVFAALVAPPGVIGDCPVTLGTEPGSIPADLPIFDLNEEADVLLLMLEYVYPRPAPSLSTLRFATVKALFSASRRYEVWRAIDASVAQLKALAPAQPFVVYSIAMHAREDCLSPTGGQVGLAACEALAKEASFHTLKHDLGRFNKSYFASLSGGAAHALWALHTNRLAQGKNIILSMPFLADPSHGATCPEHRLMERYWADEARRVAEELHPELDMQRKVVIREPNGAGCLHCYRALLRTASTVRSKWEKVPDVVAI